MKAKWDAEFPGQFEAVIVPDMELEGAYDAGMQGKNLELSLCRHLPTKLTPCPKRKDVRP